MRATAAKHSCDSMSLSGAPGNTSRKLFAGRLVKDRNVLPRVVCHRDHNAWHAFALKQRCEQLSGGATGRVNCGRDNTEPLKNPSYVDSTSPWITVGRRTPHFGERHHFVYR